MSFRIHPSHSSCPQAGEVKSQRSLGKLLGRLSNTPGTTYHISIYNGPSGEHNNTNSCEERVKNACALKLESTQGSVFSQEELLADDVKEKEFNAFSLQQNREYIEHIARLEKEKDDLTEQFVREKKESSELLQQKQHTENLFNKQLESLEDLAQEHIKLDNAKNYMEYLLQQQIDQIKQENHDHISQQRHLFDNLFQKQKESIEGLTRDNLILTQQKIAHKELFQQQAALIQQLEKIIEAQASKISMLTQQKEEAESFLRGQKESIKRLSKDNSLLTLQAIVIRPLEETIGSSHQMHENTQQTTAAQPVRGISEISGKKRKRVALTAEENEKRQKEARARANRVAAMPGRAERIAAIEKARALKMRGKCEKSSNRTDLEGFSELGKKLT